MLYVCKIEENGVVHVKDTDDGSVEQMQYYELIKTVETLGIKVAGVNFGRVSIPSQVEMRVAAYGDAAKRMVQGSNNER